ncbi:hypothetical protein ACFYVL_27580 [Streptomyces sp. NPDC004111]|uniref:hypothetical protein n=1 Tax=Streptomyces sp. NPDC004111 TaxID=3364690 RepID=UPI003675A91D
MHQHIRTVAGAAAVAAALLLTGCSSDGAQGDKAKPSDGAVGSGADQGSGSGGAGTPPAGDAGAGDVTGSWTATANGKLVVLTIQGDMAGIAGENLCTGRVVRQGGVTLDMKCPNGNTDRAKGTVTAGGDGRTLTVKWEGSGTEEKFTKAAGAGLPSGVPTDFPSGLPSAAPKVPGT